MAGRLIMDIASGIKLRLRIVASCARVIFIDKSLLFFPCISMITACVTLGFFYFTVGPDKMQLMLNTLRNESGVQTINVGYYGALAVAIYLVVTLATAMNFALVACINISLDGEDSRIWDGFGVLLKRLPAILVWSLFSITLGALWTIFDQERRSSAFLRRTFGNTWNCMSMLAVPVVVLENRNIFSAVIRSRTMMKDTWGTNLTANFGTLWFVVILSVPLLLKYALLRMSGTGITLPFAEFALAYFVCAVILAQTAKAVYKVVMYRYAARGEISPGFDQVILEGAFRTAGEPPKSGGSNEPAKAVATPTGGEVQMADEACSPDELETASK